MKQIRKTNLIKITPIVFLLTSCAATEVALSHRNLESSTKLSKTVFLDPVSNDKIYLLGSKKYY